MSIFIDNKYTRWYYAIIDNAKSRIITGYVEKHHIIPKSLGGSNSKDNLVKLTAREHFIVHRLLIHMTLNEAKKKMIHALWSFIRSSSNQQRIVMNARQYELIRKQVAIMLSNTRQGNLNANFGKTLTLEHKQKLSQALKGKEKTLETKLKMKKAWENRSRVFSDEHRLNLSIAGKGRIDSDETRKKKSKSKIGKEPWNKGIKWKKKSK